MKLKPEIVFIYDLLYKEYEIESRYVLGIYLFGSRLYGTNHEQSDYDYIVIVKDNKPYRYYDSEYLDIHIYNEAEYEKEMNMYRMGVIECALQTILPHEQCTPILSYMSNFSFGEDFDLWELRKGISSIVHNSYDKAKKKIIKEGDFYIGCKSLFHSIRILDYGIQLATMFDRDMYFQFNRCNVTYNKIMSMYDGFVNDTDWFLERNSNKYKDCMTDDEQRILFWELLEDEFRYRHNENVKMFRILCPKPEGESNEK